MLWSSRSWEEQRPLERFFLALANGGFLREQEFVWQGVWGSAFCPVCRARGHLYWSDTGGEFRFGCKERCERAEILECLGLSSTDVLEVRPKWLT